MIKTTTILEVRIQDRIYIFNIPNEAPIGEIHDALYQMRSFVVNRMNEVLNAELPKKEVKDE